MKIKGVLAALVVGVLAVGMLTACGSKEEDGPDTTKTETATPEGAYVSYNGTNVAIDMPFADVKDGLGTETKPAETIEPCGGGDYIQEMHFYDGLTVNTLRGETVIGVEIPADGGSSALMMGKVKKGDSAEDAKAALGTPASEDEYTLSYSIGNSSVMLYIDQGSVTSMGIMKNPE